MQTGGGGPGRRGGGGRGRPLVITGDGELLDELLELAGAGGVDLTVAVDALAAEDHWPSAPLVVVGADQVEAVARRRLPRRLGVVLVTRAPTEAGAAAGPSEPGNAWSGAEALHAEHVVLLPHARSWLVARLAECRPRVLRHAAPVVAFVSTSGGSGAGTLALGLALVARRRGLSVLLVRADPAGPPADHVVSAGGGTLAVLDVDRSDGARVPPEAMAAALRAARHGRDLVVVDLPHPIDPAARLALSSADRCYLVVAAEIRACAAAARVAAHARRHCPGLALVVRTVVPGGLRPNEVAEALDLPLAGVLPPPAADPVASSPRPSSSDARGADAGNTADDPGLRAVSGLCRRLLADSGARRRATDRPPAAHQSAAAAVVNR